MLLKLTKLLLAPTLTHAAEASEDALASAGRSPQWRAACGPSPCLFASAFRQVGRAHLRAMPPRTLQRMHTRLGILLKAPTRFWAGGLILRQQGLPAALACLTGGGIPQSCHPGCARRPGLRGAVLGPMLPRMEPPPHPARAWPHRRHGVAQARGPVGRERHGRLEAALAQSAPHLPTTLSACPVGGRQTAPPLPSIPTDAPDPQETRCTPPAAPRRIDGLHTPRRAGIAAEGTGPQRLRRVRQAVGEVTHRTLRDHPLAARVRQRARNGAWGPPAGRHLADQAGAHVAGPAARRPPLRARRCPEAPAWGPRQPEAPCGGLPGALLVAMAIPLGRRLPLIAAPAQGLALFLLEGLLEPPCRGASD
jgi:hypothetical protein